MDLTDQQWTIIEPLFEEKRRLDGRGRPWRDFHPIAKSQEMRMAMRIRVTTRADLFERRKQQHIERGYRVEDERPIPVNGFCSFIAISEIPDSDGVGDLVAQVLSGMAK